MKASWWNWSFKKPVCIMLVWCHKRRVRFLPYVFCNVRGEQSGLMVRCWTTIQDVTVRRYALIRRRALQQRFAVTQKWRCENIPLPKGAFWQSEAWSINRVILHNFISWDKSMGRKQDANEETKETEQQERDWNTEQEGNRFYLEQEPKWR